MTVDQATRLRELVAASQPRARVVAVTSGKGGVGKSTIALNLSIAAARYFKRVVLVDADFGLANLDVMCGVTAKAGLSEVIRGSKRLYEVALETPFGVRLVPGASGIAYLADLPDEDRTRLLTQMEVLEREADLVIVDTGAGVSRNVVKMAAAADEILVVTTPEPPSITDGYAAIKLISRELEHGRIGLVVNQVASKAEAQRVARRVISVAQKFLSVSVEPSGYVLSDHHVPRAVRMRRPLLAEFKTSPAALCVGALASRWKVPAPGVKGGGFISRLKRILGGGK